MLGVISEKIKVVVCCFNPVYSSPGGCFLSSSTVRLVGFSLTLIFHSLIPYVFCCVVLCVIEISGSMVNQSINRRGVRSTSPTQSTHATHTTIQFKTKHDETKHDETKHNETKHGKTNIAKQNKTNQNNTNQKKTKKLSLIHI